MQNQAIHPIDPEKHIEDGHLGMLLQEIYEQFGADFRHYASQSLKRRIARICTIHRLGHVLDLRKMFDHPRFIQDFITDLTVGVTEMFRDPEAWAHLRDKVLPLYAPEASLSLWHCGCSTGEEVYSAKILFREEQRSPFLHQLATDLNPEHLAQAQAAQYSFRKFELYEKNYVQFGGKRKLSDYYTLENFNGTLDPGLKKGIRFEEFNLTERSKMGPFDMIFCRNVMIYFDQHLQNEVLGFFHQCLHPKGWLVMGQFESLIWCPNFKLFHQPNSMINVMQKV